MSAEEVSQAIAKLEETGVIRHYKTIVDWDLVGENYVYAVIELKVTLERNQGYQAIAERIYKFPEVRSVRLLSGNYDISLTVRGKSMKDVAFFVAEKIATLDQVQSTSTHFVLKTYKEDGVILHAAGDPVLWSVKLTVRGVFPEAGDAENLETGVLFKTFETTAI